ncbi:hypothetical protein chiPu_0022405, partial [Chiloscyllium punctatum]|nr:hypothetical protein [Chiloscyllium punctatum]
MPPVIRLSWPALLYHPFVADRINVVDDSQDCGIEKPFTIQASPETQALKEQQAKELAPRSGHSKILRKAREKMLEESKKKHSAQPGEPARQAQADPRGEPRPKQPLCTPERAPLLLGTQRAAPPSREAGADGSPGTSSTAEREKDQRQPPTPGLHHITQDYEREFPEVQVGPRLLRRRSHSMENVDLDNE